MSLRSLLAGLRARWIGSFDRAIAEGRVECARQERARDEFINTLIIDHTASAREFEGRTLGGRLRD